MTQLRSFATASVGSGQSARACKLCGNVAREIFALPKSKLTGHPIPAEPDDCPYFECRQCGFVFTDGLDNEVQTEIYDPDYWVQQDGAWYGRVSQSLRLVTMASGLIGRPADVLRILDFGCGMGAFVEAGRRDLALQVWGTDIITPALGKDYYLPSLEDQKFDVIIACEVIEHLPDPLNTMQFIRSHLTEGGAFAFQTAVWDPAQCDRDWWYLGPANGHISLYSTGAFDFLFGRLGGGRRRMWAAYPGLQAWQFGEQNSLERRSLLISAAELRAGPNASLINEQITEDRASVGETVCYGPYVSLPAGKYVGIVSGNFSHPYLLRLTADTGATRIHETTIGGSSPTFCFEATGPLSNFECVVRKTVPNGRSVVAGIILVRDTSC